MLALRESGMDVLRSLDAGMNSRSDEEQLDFATSHGRAIYTRNARDFRRLHRDFQAIGRSHAGIIIWSADYSIGEQLRRILRLRDAVSAEQMANSEQFISQWGEDLRP